MEHSSHEITADPRSGDGFPPVRGSADRRLFECDRDGFPCLRLYSSNTWGAIPQMISRGVGLKLAIAAAVELYILRGREDGPMMITGVSESASSTTEQGGGATSTDRN